MVTFYDIPVSATLSPFVKYFRVVEGDGSATFSHRSVAFGFPSLFFHYKGIFEEYISDKKFTHHVHAHVQGQTQNYRLFSSNGSFGILGVICYPFVTPLLFGIPSYDITDQIVPIEDLLGHDGKELAEKVALAPNSSERVRLVSSFLEGRLLNNQQKDIAIQEAIKYTVESLQGQTVLQLAKQFNLSKKQFERKFREYSGFNPKLYSRILRFHEAMKHNNFKLLSDIAYSCGYYDQAHFNHEFRIFTGCSPSEYFKQGDSELIASENLILNFTEKRNKCFD